MAQHTKELGESAPDNPAVEVASLLEFSSVLAAVSVYVIDPEKLKMGLMATATFRRIAAIMGQHNHAVLGIAFLGDCAPMSSVDAVPPRCGRNVPSFVLWNRAPLAGRTIYAGLASWQEAAATPWMDTKILGRLWKCLLALFTLAHHSPIIPRHDWVQVAQVNVL